MDLRTALLLVLIKTLVSSETGDEDSIRSVVTGDFDSGFEERRCLTKDYMDEKFLTMGNSIDKCNSVSKDCASMADITTLISSLKKLPQDCEDIQNTGNLATGIYTIYPHQNTTGLQVRCDMDTTTGGWTLIQRRVSDSDFYKNWKEYEDGFGNLGENFWLGNRNIHWLTRQGRYTLRIDLTSTDGQTAYAEYREFTTGNAKSGYRLYIIGYSGTAGDSLSGHNGMQFSTLDRDNDMSGRSCAVLYHGAWWYDKCHSSNLNGDYGYTASAKGPVWSTWKGYHSPMKVTEMKIRRIVN